MDEDGERTKSYLFFMNVRERVNTPEYRKPELTEAVGTPVIISQEVVAIKAEVVPQIKLEKTTQDLWFITPRYVDEPERRLEHRLGLAHGANLKQ
ncbi:hypothetical protein HOY80DRAFT_1051287 [Tuber brumale]|nr:hypothetical protein HOY80DRAFT_1051287 [Tuber brumale]